MSRSFLAGAAEQSLFILHKPLIVSSIRASAAIPRDGLPQKLSRSHCATQKAAIREISLNLIFHNCTFSKKVLDTFGNDGFRGKQDVAMVRCPRNRTGLLIRFTAIIATVLVQSPGCNLIGQRRNENGNSIVGRSQFGYSLPQIMKSCIVCMLKRNVRIFHHVPLICQCWGRCMAEAGFPPQNEAAYFQVFDEMS